MYAHKLIKCHAVCGIKADGTKSALIGLETEEQIPEKLAFAKKNDKSGLFVGYGVFTKYILVQESDWEEPNFD